MKKINIKPLTIIAFSCFLIACSELGNYIVLNEPEIVQSYPCKDKVHFDQSENISMFTLSQDFEIRGNTIPENSTIEIQGKEMLIYLSKPTEIKGYLVRKRKHTNDHCTLDEQGNLIFFVPVNDITIDKIPCMGQKDIWLYPSGKLFMCHLADDFDHSNNNFKKGQFVLIDDQGIMCNHTWSKFHDIRKSGLYPNNH